MWGQALGQMLHFLIISLTPLRNPAYVLFTFEASEALPQ